ncbi:unnamed protein product [Caenorhabditis auriculariae]|uniref:Uncharacterized protein n=1 Tax=Caenorhabditis auriculariae TaxID=2777116 RepID=A0A8S1HRG7_9PELO|nr:unnamed protein product [Caenorhabditis auriculariae]
MLGQRAAVFRLDQRRNYGKRSDDDERYRIPYSKESHRWTPRRRLHQTPPTPPPLPPPVAVPKRYQIEVTSLPTTARTEASPCKITYWVYPNMAITREVDDRCDIVGECVFLDASDSHVFVNLTPQENKFVLYRCAHTAHTPPSGLLPVKSRPDYMQTQWEQLGDLLAALSVESNDD